MNCDIDTTHLLATLSEKSRRQVELTLNAFCRSTRKALRQAELLDKRAITEEVSAERRVQAWQEVDRRCETLCSFINQLQGAKPAQDQPQPAPEVVEEPKASQSLTKLQVEAARVASLPRKTIGQVRHAQREEAKLLALYREQSRDGEAPVGTIPPMIR